MVKRLEIRKLAGKEWYIDYRLDKTRNVNNVHEKLTLDELRALMAIENDKKNKDEQNHETTNSEKEIEWSEDVYYGNSPFTEDALFWDIELKKIFEQWLGMLKSELGEDDLKDFTKENVIKEFTYHVHSRLKELIKRLK